MKRLGIVVPSRGRPAHALRLADAVGKLSQSGSTDLLVGTDYDDALGPGYLAALGGRPGVYLLQGERESMVARTNSIWRDYSDVYDYWCSLGDDHVPMTEGWDVKLISAIEDGLGGTGIAYPNDTVMGPNLPTAAVMSRDIPETLGWIGLPSLSHYCCDNAWKDIGMGAGCLAYCPDVIVQHRHWSASLAMLDATYAEAGGFSVDHPDYAAYLRWQDQEASANIEAIRQLVKDRIG